MKNDKFCFDEKVVVMTLVGIILVILVFFSQGLLSLQTSTNSRASASTKINLAESTFFSSCNGDDNRGVFGYVGNNNKCLLKTKINDGLSGYLQSLATSTCTVGIKDGITKSMSDCEGTCCRAEENINKLGDTLCAQVYRNDVNPTCETTTCGDGAIKANTTTTSTACIKNINGSLVEGKCCIPKKINSMQKNGSIKRATTPVPTIPPRNDSTDCGEDHQNCAESFGGLNDQLTPIPAQNDAIYNIYSLYETQESAKYVLQGVCVYGNFKTHNNGDKMETKYGCAFAFPQKLKDSGFLCNGKQYATKNNGAACYTTGQPGGATYSPTFSSVSNQLFCGVEIWSGSDAQGINGTCKGKNDSLLKK
jgi:hypothetical protein